MSYRMGPTRATRRDEGPHGVGRTSLVALAASTVCALLARAGRARLDTPGGLDAAAPETSLVLAAALLGALVAGWLALAAALHLLALVPGRLGTLSRRVAHVVTPALVRRVLSVTLGASALTPVTAVAAGATTAPSPPAVATTPAAPSAPGVPADREVAYERPGPPDPSFAPVGDPGPGGAATSPGTDAGVRAPDAGWTPARPRPTRQPGLDVLGGRPVAEADVEDGTYVVRRGDCLWDVVERHLGRRATTAAVAEAVPRWYAANRAVIGDDPDLISPGTTLHAPTDPS